MSMKIPEARVTSLSGPLWEVLRQVSRDGWTLTTERVRRTAAGIPGPAVSTVDWLAVTAGQAKAVAGTRSCAGWHDTHRGIVVRTVRVTMAEAEAIAGGAHPLTVLCPRFTLRARALTLKELMSR